MKTRKSLLGVVLLLFTAGIIALSILGPEMLSRYQDKKILNEIHLETAADEGEGYRYALSGSEKLYILSEALANFQTTNPVIEVGYEETAGAHAFIVNHRGPYEKQITAEDVYSSCNQQLTVFKEIGILPVSVMDIDPEVHTAVLYSAIDVLEPRNNVSVWQISLSDTQRNVSRQYKLMEAYLDADDGKLYEFYVRTEWDWASIDPDQIAASWCEYMELAPPTRYESVNPLLETTPYFQKYWVSGDHGEEILITVGFYEGINELFLKVGR